MSKPIQTTQAPQQQVTPFNQLRTDLNSMASQFKAVLPEHVTPERFIRVVLTAAQNTPSLLNCDRGTLFSASLKCAADGLVPDGKEAAFIPYGQVVQYQPMVAGIIKKVRNSKEISLLCADVVYREDDFKFGTSSEKGRYLDHVPNMDAGVSRGTKDNATAAFALSRTKDGDIDFEVMTTAEIEFVRSKSKSANSPAWKEWWGEMAKKTVLKRLAKRLPTSADVQDLIDRDNEEYHVEQVNSKSSIQDLQNKLHHQAHAQLEQQQAPVNDPNSFDNFQAGTPVVNEDPRMVK